MSPEAIAGVGLSAMLVFLWADDTTETYREWRAYRDPRSFRTFLKASLLFVGSIAFLLGAFYVYLWPGSELMRDISRGWGWVVRSGLLIIGVVIFLTRLRS